MNTTYKVLAQTLDGENARVIVAFLVDGKRPADGGCKYRVVLGHMTTLTDSSGYITDGRVDFTFSAQPGFYEYVMYFTGHWMKSAPELSIDLRFPRPKK